jgi:hypothetical protein
MVRRVKPGNPRGGSAACGHPAAARESRDIRGSRPGGERFISHRRKGACTQHDGRGIITRNARVAMLMLYER